jgi:hypothetical protein
MDLESISQPLYTMCDNTSCDNLEKVYVNTMDAITLKINNLAHASFFDGFKPIIK